MVRRSPAAVGHPAFGVARREGLRLDANLLNPVEADLVVGPVVELSRSCRAVSGDVGGVIDGTAMFEVVGDARCPERVIADLARQAGVPERVA